MTNLMDALNERFTDADEIKDVAEHGCSGGVSGFIYYREIEEFFNKHEEEIEDTIANLGYDLKDLIDDDTYSVMTLKNKMVWIVVEAWCQAKVDEL